MINNIGEDIYKYITDNSADTIYIIGLDGTIKFVSPSVKRTFGYRPEEVTGKNIREFMTTESYEKQASKMETALMEKGADVSEKLVVSLMKKKGGLVETEIHARFLVDGDNNLIGILGIARDVSDRLGVGDNLR